MVDNEEWVSIDKFSELYNDGCVTYTSNDESDVEESDDFASSCDFLEEFYKIYNVHSQDETESGGGEMTAVDFFQSNCSRLAKTIQSGYVKFFWLTCEDEDNRIDLWFENGLCKFRLHINAVDLEEPDYDS
jgi:hypothetical protein